MNWTQIKSQDLEAALNKTQLELLKSESLKTSGYSITDEIIAMIISDIRSKVANYNANYIDYDHSKIPAELKLSAIRLCVEALQSRIPAMELNAQQKKLADIAREDLEKIYTGKILVSYPDDPIKTSVETKGVFFSKKKGRKISGESLKGL